MSENKNQSLSKTITIITVSLFIRVIMGMLASYYSSPYIESDPEYAGIIYHMWDIAAQSILALGIGFAFWKNYLAPFSITIGIIQMARVVDVYLREAYKYNFNETFFFSNILLWGIYTTILWKMSNFRPLYILSLFVHLLLAYSYISFIKLT